MKLVYLWERSTRKYYHLACSLFVFMFDNNRYNVFPPLDPTLFLSPVSPTNSPYDKSPSVNRATSQSAISSVAIRTQAEKTKNKNVSFFEIQ